jgi:hypothetical protein
MKKTGMLGAVFMSASLALTACAGSGQFVQDEPQRLTPEERHMAELSYALSGCVAGAQVEAIVTTFKGIWDEQDTRESWERMAETLGTLKATVIACEESTGFTIENASEFALSLEQKYGSKERVQELVNNTFLPPVPQPQ